MQWLEVSVSLHREALEAVTEIMLRWGASGVEIDDPRLILERQTSLGDWDYVELPPDFNPNAEAVLRTWLQIDGATPDKVRNIEQEILRLPDYGLEIGSATLTTGVVADQNWAEAWKAYFKPLRVGERLLIKPAWEEWLGADEIIIELDPGLAFGTGNHATTRMCLVLLERYLHPGQEVIDVGCGSGILSVAAAKLGAGRVEAIDIDPLAVESTQANLTLNNLEHCHGENGKIQVRCADLLSYSDGTADIVLANIVADVVIRLLQDISRVLKPSGLVICSGIIKERLSDVAQALTDTGFTIKETLFEDDWVAVMARLAINN